MSFLPDRVMIIAEIGSNHDGDLDKALTMIDVAADCGADVAKFQSFLADEMYAPSHPDYDMLKRLEMPREWYPRLIARCEDRGVRFLSTATNFTTIDWMEEEGVAWYKIASGNINHYPIIERMLEIGKPLILSTGLTSPNELIDLQRLFQNSGLDSYAFLHCVSAYPAPAESIRLKNITVLQQLLDCPIGFSDHSLDANLSIAATALGARILEKHISLDGEGFSPDHSFAMTPEPFGRMCEAVREVESGLFTDFSANAEMMYSLRRSLHFARELKEGDVITAADIKITRPEDGLQPKDLNQVIGRRVKSSTAADEAVVWTALSDGD